MNHKPDIKVVIISRGGSRLVSGIKNQDGDKIEVQLTAGGQLLPQKVSFDIKDAEKTPNSSDRWSTPIYVLKDKKVLITE